MGENTRQNCTRQKSFKSRKPQQAAALPGFLFCTNLTQPTGAVDTRTADTIYELFQKLNKELGITIIIVTHDMALAGRVDRTVLISDGKVSTEKLKKHPAMEYTVLDKAHRIKLTDEMLEAAGIESNKVRVDVQDGKLVISRI